jgi:uncharacterized protein with PIN domain
VTVYAESSAVMAWLLDEARAPEVEAVLASADRVATSDLTLIECDRAIGRLVRMPGPVAALVEPTRGRLKEAVAAWAVEPISGPVVERARASFPDDAIRSLHAIHLATALVIRAAAGDLDVLSLDDRVRSNARALGFRVLPD